MTVEKYQQSVAIQTNNIINILNETEYVNVTIRTREQFEDATLHGFPVYYKEWQDDKGIAHHYCYIRIKWSDLMKLGD